jgi:hypothetical protein
MSAQHTKLALSIRLAGVQSPTIVLRFDNALQNGSRFGPDLLDPNRRIELPLPRMGVQAKHPLLSLARQREAIPHCNPSDTDCLTARLGRLLRSYRDFAAETAKNWAVQ